MIVTKAGFLVAIALFSTVHAQTNEGSSALANATHLHFKSTAKVSYTGRFSGTPKCDDHGLIYTKLVDPDGSKQYRAAAVWPIKSINPDGTIAGSFDFHEMYPTFRVIHFFVAGDGKVYLAARSDAEGDVYVVTTPSMQAVRLETDYFIPYQIAVFKSGEFLLSGIKGDHHRTPYTAVFSSRGKLIKTIYEPEDEEARVRAINGERGFRPDELEFGNNFVVRGDATLGADGNVYLLRAGDPALIYVVSSKGEVLRKLRVPAPGPGLVARILKAGADTLAISFLDQTEKKGMLAMTDYQGRLMSVDSTTDARLSPGRVACYDSAGFTYLDGDSQNLQIHKAEMK